LDKAFVEPPKTFYHQEMKNANPGRFITLYQIGELFGKYKQAASSVTDLFPCDMNIFRPRDFPLASGNVDAAPVNHPALVKTSYHPPYSSANFSPFTSGEALRSSDISPVPSLN
jgi:hypothetical protein